MYAGGAVTALDMNALLPASLAAQYAGVSVAAICKWRERGHLPVATDPETSMEIRDNRGRPLYRLIDVAKAEHATKQRADRMAATASRKLRDAA